MSDGEEHSNDLELGCGGDMVHDKDPGKIRGGGKRMEEKTEKPKRHYKKRAPKQRPTTEGEAGEISKTPSRNRVTKRDAGATKSEQEQQSQNCHLSLRQNCLTHQEGQADFCSSTPESSSLSMNSSPMDSPPVELDANGNVVHTDTMVTMKMQ